MHRPFCDEREARRAVFLLLALLTLTGCNRHFFAAAGQVSAAGPAFGDWASTPIGCSRDPIDGLPDRRTATIATFFWQDPAMTNPMFRDHRMAHVPDAPAQINLIRGPGGTYNLRLQTVQTSGWLIHSTDCSRLEIDTHEQPPAFPGGRPSLAGTVQFSCNVKQSQVSANLTFTRCDY